MKTFEDMYATTNANVRFEVVESVGSDLAVPMLTFFRKAQLRHVYDELVTPVLSQGSGLVVTAVVDRPWPPWGIDAAEVVGAVVVHPIGRTEASINPIIVGDENATNVGLSAALLRATLKHLVSRDIDSISYLVHEDGVLIPRLLASLKFAASDEYYLTRNAKYRLYRGRLADLLETLGLDAVLAPDLLAGRLEEPFYFRNALYALATQTAARGHWQDNVAGAELISNRGTPLGDSPPGGIGGTSGPKDPVREFEIEEVEIVERPLIDNPAEREEKRDLITRR